MSSYASQVKTGIIKYVRDTFGEDDWMNLALETDSIDRVRNHSRLLKSLSFGDNDYVTHVAGVVPKLLEDGGATSGGALDIIRVAELFPGLLGYLREADPTRYDAIRTNEATIPTPWLDDVRTPATAAHRSAMPDKSEMDPVSASMAATEGQRKAAENLIEHKVEEASAEKNPPSPAGAVRGLEAQERSPKKSLADDLLERLGSVRMSDISSTTTSKATTIDADQSIFIVHGSDTEFLGQVQIFIHKITGVMPVVLKEEPDLGRTIIEKFEQVTKSSSTAVVLLTPDDVGARVGGQMRDRARQNVILEWGYLVAHLGRQNTIAINKGVEIPSDFQGLVYIPLDNWKESLRTNLQAAGITMIG